ncbi:antitoxin MazE family protein [Pseudarthrobacter raffinosi]|uniref:antitoxin MazE family protein n=1 Tax=Pseudarthrobacter raffinosi TaxID=2953651 RepID=UPI0021123FD3|nr:MULTISPECIES: antitoxin MazE family protein [unclassified Pseudarthrobacter]
MSVRDRVARHRIAMRERGLRQIQMWVPDARTEEFKREARRQSLAVAASDRAGDDQDFIEEISEDWPE